MDTTIPDVNKVSAGVFPTTTDISALGALTPNIPQVQPTTVPTIENLAQQALKDSQTTQLQKKGDEVALSTANLIAQLSGQTQALSEAEQQAGVATFQKQLQGLNSQILTKQAELAQDDVRLIAGLQGIEDKAIPMEFITGQQASLQQKANIARALKQSEIGMLNAQVLAAQGNIALAQQTAQKAVDLKYAPIKEAISINQAQLEAIKPLLDKQEKRQALAQTNLYNLQLKQIEQAQADQKELQTFAINIQKNGAPQDLVSKILSSKSIFDAIPLAANYIQSPAEKADLSYKLAQTAKLYNDMKSTGENDPVTTLAYAQEYAATGKIPTGLPKGYFGNVADFAKSLPKQSGEIVSTSTGVKPYGDNTYSDALSSLYSAINLSKDLRKLDDQRIGGLVAGTLGKAFGSDAQQRYVDLRQQIVDLLSRARSGAAINETELKQYESMLPGRFSEPFGLGADSSVRIDNFTDNLTKDLQNKASSKGWSIYGLSKIKVGNEQYTVGDIIKNNKGQSGRINADGSVTLL